MSPSCVRTNITDELSTFYAQFDLLNEEAANKSAPPPEDRPLSGSTADVSRSDLHISHPITRRVLVTCANQLTDLLSDISHIFHWRSHLLPDRHYHPCNPSVVKTTTALIAIVMCFSKCFQKLFLLHIKNNIPARQFSHRTNRSTEDAASAVLHSALTHLEDNNTYIRMLFVDVSSAFNTVSPMICKLCTLGFSFTLDIRLLHKQTPGSLDWRRHSCSHCTPTTGNGNILYNTNHSNSLFTRQLSGKWYWSMCQTPDDHISLWLQHFVFFKSVVEWQ